MAVMVSTRMLTRDDLDALPDDGLRHELVDGTFVMTPAPGVPHQRFLLGLYRALHLAVAETDLEVLVAPLDVVLGPHVVEPDLIIAPRAAFSQRDLSTAPLLVVEVRSPSTAWLDEGRKRSLYEESGVTQYWLADPVKPSVTVLTLVDGRYEQTALVQGEEVLTLHSPLHITVRPSDLAGD